jgi:hypothetical protein
MAKLHWSDLVVDSSHAWGQDGHCVGCMMHRSWPGSRDKCSMKVPKPKRQGRPLAVASRGLRRGRPVTAWPSSASV